MGEMADYILDSILVPWSGTEPDPEDADIHVGGKKEIKCKICGKTNLKWEQTKHGKWWFKDRETGTWHTCKKDKNRK